jgi:hypothetical protein
VATFGELKAKVADDMLVGAATGAQQIEDAVLAAIKKYESRRFWFTESRTVVFNTVVGQSDYSDIDGWGRIISADYLDVSVGCDGCRFDYETPAYVDWLLSVTSTPTGKPSMWTTFGGILRLYPKPDILYPIRVTGHITFPVLEDDDDENVWTDRDQGFELIRHQARWDLANNTTHDDAMAARAKMAAEEALDDLIAETGRRSARGFVVPVNF